MGGARVVDLFDVRKRHMHHKRLPPYIFNMHRLQLFECNLTEYIEDGYKEKQITCTVYVDLTAAYETVNQTSSPQGSKRIRYKTSVSIIQLLLESKRFFGEMNGRKSRWWLQNIGLLQGTVLVPTNNIIYI